MAMLNQVTALQPHEVLTALKIAEANGLYTPAQVALIKERCQGFVTGKPADDYEVIAAKDQGTLSGFVIFRKRTLTEATFEISHIGVVDHSQTERVLATLREEVLNRTGKLIMAELPDLPNWRPILDSLQNAGYSVVGQTLHLYGPGSGTRHYVLYLNHNGRPDTQTAAPGYMAPQTNFPSPQIEWPAAVTSAVSNHRKTILDMTAHTPVFTADDLAIVEELIDIYLREGPAGGYSFLSCLHDNAVIAYCCFGQRPSTLGTYDLYWICTDARFRQHGAGRSLMTAVEAEVIKQGGYLVVLETSDTPPFTPTRKFYEAIGYARIVYIKQFYSADDGLVVFAKYLKPLAR